MNTRRKIAITVGVLFVIAFVLDYVGRAMYEPTLYAPDFLVNAFPNKILMTTGILLEFIAGIAIVLIPVALFPIFKKHNEALALGYLGFRFLEGILFMVFPVVKSLSLISLSQEYTTSGAQNAAYLQTLGTSIQAQSNWGTLIYIIVFCLGALLFNYVLYQSKLIPRWISVWGFIATSMLLAGAIVGVFDIVDTTNIMMFLGLPFALNEMLMAGWLIVKGFNSPKSDAASGETEKNISMKPARA